jgi:Transposase DDE domain
LIGALSGCGPACGGRAAKAEPAGGYYGLKVHCAVDIVTGLPVAWQVETAKDSEIPMVPVLLESAMERGFAAQVAILDRGYDTEALYTLLEGRDIRPVIPLRMTPAVKRGMASPPSCEHGTWAFAGSDAKRGASKWRCPSGECKPGSAWVKASRLHPLIPRETERYKSLYHQRGAVEREFGHLKHEWAMLPLRVRRLPRVRLHVDLTILAQLSSALLATRTP